MAFKANSWTRALYVLAFFIFSHLERDSELTWFQGLCCSLCLEHSTPVFPHYSVLFFFWLNSHLQCHFFKKMILVSLYLSLTLFHVFCNAFCSQVYCAHTCVIVFCHTHASSLRTETLSVSTAPPATRTV